MFKRQLYYAGVGSRETPSDVLTDMYRLARVLAPLYRLRSGAADGADAAFEAGAVDARGKVDIYLAWAGFNGHSSPKHHVTREALELASSVHPRWENLGQGPRKLHARNCYQVLGEDLQTPVEFVLCYTADGCETESERRSTTGGTATAIVLAARNGIPVYNLCKDSSRERLVAYLEREHELEVGWLLRHHQQKDLF